MSQNDKQQKSIRANQGPVNREKQEKSTPYKTSQGEVSLFLCYVCQRWPMID